MATLPLLLCGVWVIAANLVALPAEKWLWPAAVLPVATGIPLLGLVTWFYGPIAGLFAFGIGVALLRWPVRLTRRRRDTDADPQAQPAE